MKVLALLARKGGCGKTLLSVHLGVAASQAGYRVVMADADSQRSLTGWGRDRTSSVPQVLAVTATGLQTTVVKAKKALCDLLIVDTRGELQHDAVIVARLADFCLIPSRPQKFDIEAAEETAGALVGLGIGDRCGIVLNACPPKRGVGEAEIVGESRRRLARTGIAVLEPIIGQRTSLGTALIGGTAVTEFEPDGRAAVEIRALWKTVEKILWPVPAALPSTSPRSRRVPLSAR